MADFEQRTLHATDERIRLFLENTGFFLTKQSKGAPALTLFHREDSFEPEPFPAGSLQSLLPGDCPRGTTVHDQNVLGQDLIAGQRDARDLDRQIDAILLALRRYFGALRNRSRFIGPKYQVGIHWLDGRSEVTPLIPIDGDP